MRLEVASPNQLYISMAISGILLLLFGWAVTLAETPLAFYVALIFIAYLVIGLLIAGALMGSTVPLLRATRDGLEIHPLLSKRSLVPWNEVGTLKYFDFHYSFFRVPGIGQLQVKFKGKVPLKWGLNYLPMGWFGIFMLPGRIARGGGHAASQFCALANQLRKEEPGAQYTVEGTQKKEVLWQAVDGISLPVDMKKLLTGETVR